MASHPSKQAAPPDASLSLPEVHASVSTAQTSFWRRLFAFFGPAYIISVGYMDPGNWATDLEGGARFGYDLLWVLVLSNAMAIILQTLSARLGIVARRDLAQACRETYPKPISWMLWLLCELAIAACDLAELLGAAIALKLLFGIPLLVGVVLTAADTLLILWLTRFGIRPLEAFVLALVSVIAGCFAIEIILARPDFQVVARGLVPKLTSESLYVAIGILGATVMPHNLYLHSALVQTRQIGDSVQEQQQACRYNLIDSVVALNGALLVNVAILVLAGSVFYQRGIVVTEIEQAHHLLAPLLGTTAAGILFGVALLCAGQSSTLTGTMAGQIVMEGFLRVRMRPWLRRLITRLVAIVPAIVAISLVGDAAGYRLLILSQVILSLQLPFAVVPLIHFTSDRARMGSFANPRWVKVLAWLAAAIIVALNAKLVSNTLLAWWSMPSSYQWLVRLLLVPLVVGLSALLAWITVEPFLPRFFRQRGRAAVALPAGVGQQFSCPLYRNILVTLDHTDLDHEAVAHAANLARQHMATIHLLHIEEGVTSQVYGPLASTAEVRQGIAYLEEIASHLRLAGLRVETTVQHAQSPKEAIVSFAQQLQPDLIIMGAHGHRGIRDIIYGTTINSVRHEVKAPLLIVQQRNP